MTLMDRISIREAMSKSEKMLPLTLALIEAATEQGANIKEFRDACMVATALFEDKLNHLAASDLKSDTQTAFESFRKLLLTITS